MHAIEHSANSANRIVEPCETLQKTELQANLPLFIADRTELSRAEEIRKNCIILYCIVIARRDHLLELKNTNIFDTVAMIIGTMPSRLRELYPHCGHYTRIMYWRIVYAYAIAYRHTDCTVYTVQFASSAHILSLAHGQLEFGYSTGVLSTVQCST